MNFIKLTEIHITESKVWVNFDLVTELYGLGNDGTTIFFAITNEGEQTCIRVKESPENIIILTRANKHGE